MQPCTFVIPIVVSCRIRDLSHGIPQQQTSRIVLLGATAIVGLTLWSSGRIARTLRAEEQRKVELVGGHCPAR